MNKFRNKLLAGGLALVTVATPIAAFAATVAEDTNLYYNGGQTDKKVYSEIGRREGSTTRNYQVKATVKVGGTTYTSGFKKNYAYKDADRVWWANESSYYDFYLE